MITSLEIDSGVRMIRGCKNENKKDYKDDNEEEDDDETCAKFAPCQQAVVLAVLNQVQTIRMY